LLRAVENKMVSRILGTKKDEVTGEWRERERRLQNEEL
jgi:hypothetical protein